MYSKVQNYIQNFFNLFTNLVREEFTYLKKKNLYLINEEFSKIEELIKQQKIALSVIIRHSKFFENHIQLIAKELGFNFENNEQLKRFNELMFKEHLFCGFITSHTSSFISILDKQLSSIQNSQKFLATVRFGSLQRHIEKEEELYNEFLKVFIEKIERIEQLIQYEQKHEHFQKIEQYVLTAAVSITAIPLGPLELASIPFWGIYFSIQVWKKHSNEFENWRMIEKNRIIKRSKESNRWRFFKK